MSTMMEGLPVAQETEVTAKAARRRFSAAEKLRVLIGKHADAWATQIAEVHAVRGEVDAAFEWLERAYAQREGGLTEMKRNPHLSSLHDDPRWGAFLEKMGFPH